jgi:hypothetical protein
VGDGLLLHPVISIPREDAWAYTPEHLVLRHRGCDGIEAC